MTNTIAYCSQCNGATSPCQVCNLSSTNKFLKHDGLACLTLCASDAGIFV